MCEFFWTFGAGGGTSSTSEPWLAFAFSFTSLGGGFRVRGGPEGGAAFADLADVRGGVFCFWLWEKTGSSSSASSPGVSTSSVCSGSSLALGSDTPIALNFATCGNTKLLRLAAHSLASSSFSCETRFFHPFSVPQ